jgi:hypothetical protein
MSPSYLKNVYSRQQNLHALFVTNVFSNKANCFTVADDDVAVYPLGKLVTFRSFKISKISRLSLPTARKCVVTANYIYRSLDIFNKHNTSLEDDISFA